MLKTQAHSETQKFLRKYMLLVILMNEIASRITKTVTLVISTLLFVEVYPDARISAFFFLSKPVVLEAAWDKEASSGNSDEITN